MVSYKWPEELECYQEARNFRITVAELCHTLPRAEEYRLKDQMLRASQSVTANIAEGFGRHHHQENIQFCRQARGSLIEMSDHFNVVVDEKYSSAEYIASCRTELESALASLNGYISYLKRCASVPKNKQ